MNRKNTFLLLAASHFSISEVCLVSNSEEPSLKWLPAPRLEPMGPHLV
jgi:hypothetical protein